MNQEFRRCLDGRKITLFEGVRGLAFKELSVAESDLSDAQAGYREGRFKWATIQGYYAMFHAARALIFARGYREKSHYCLAVALGALYVEEGKLDVQATRDFLNAMRLREAADYEAEFSESGAAAVIASASSFIDKAKSILQAK